MKLPPLTPNAWLRYDVVRRALRELDGVRSVLEIGMGEGALGSRLALRYDYVGVEPDETSFYRAQERLRRVGHGQALLGDVSTVGDRMFDLVCAFEVLEHIENDREALEQWKDRLLPGGWMLLSVPMSPDRFGPADVLAGHFRRYERYEIMRLLAGAGLAECRTWVYGFPLGYVLEAGRHILAKRASRDGPIRERTAGSGRWLQPPDGAEWVTRMATAPFRLLQRPFAGTALGTGLVVRARRPN